MLRSIKEKSISEFHFPRKCGYVPRLSGRGALQNRFGEQKAKPALAGGPRPPKIVLSPHTATRCSGEQMAKPTLMLNECLSIYYNSIQFQNTLSEGTYPDLRVLKAFLTHEGTYRKTRCLYNHFVALFNKNGISCAINLYPKTTTLSPQVRVRTTTYVCFNVLSLCHLSLCHRGVVTDKYLRGGMGEGRKPYGQADGR